LLGESVLVDEEISFGYKTHKGGPRINASLANQSQSLKWWSIV